MSSLPSTSFTNANGQGQADQSTSNTLRKDPSPRSQPVPAVPAVSKSKLVKPRASAVENDGSLESQPNLHQPSTSVSKTNRLRKALGVGSSNISGSSNADSNQSNGEPGSKFSASSNPPGSRKPSGRRNSPSSSPAIAKQPLSSTAESAPSRPGALRSQSYSKRHASFDTPREVPMPSMPFSSSSIDPIALDDGDMDRNDAAAAGWGNGPRQGMYQQSSSRQPDALRRPAADSPSTSRKPSAVPPSPENAKREGLHIDLTSEMATPTPHLSRNNSAPTPPHTPSSERMDLRYPQKIDKSTPDSAVSSVPSGSGSEQISPAPYSAQVNAERGGYMEAGEADVVDESDVGPEGTSPPIRGRMGVVFKEGRLSTSSLPLPRSYGAERVSRLPPPVRPANNTSGNASGSGSGSDSGQQAKTPTKLPDNSSTYLEESDLMKTPSTTSNATAYRTSYPFTGTFSRDFPLVPRQPSLMADIERNTQPGTAWRSSGPFMRRDYSEDDSEAKSAISSGQTPKQPEIEALRAPLNPFFATPNLTPSASNPPPSFGASSTTATPVHDLTSPPFKASDVPVTTSALAVEGGSPAASADRTSTASGSSGASSNLDSFSEPLASELKRKAPPVQQQQQEGRHSAGTSRNDNTSQDSVNTGTSAVSRPSLTTENSLASTSQGPTMTVDTTPSAYILEASLPGYQRDEITLSTRKKRILHVVADGFVSGGGHFERRVSFGYDADMSRVRAEFNGSTLRITVPRRPTPQTFATSLGSSATVGGGSSSGVGGTSMFWRGPEQCALKLEDASTICTFQSNKH